MKPLWNIVFALFCFPIHGTLSDKDCQNPCIAGQTCGTKKFRDTCFYFFNDTERTWYQSRELCKSNGLKMAKLNEDAIKQNFIMKEEKNKFVWLGGMTPNLTKWTFDSGDSQRANGSDAKTDIQGDTVMNKCGTLQINTMNFTVSILEESCDIHHQFICRLGEWHNSPVTYISEQSANWSEAKLRCSDMQGDLFYLKPHDNIQHLETKLLSFPGKTFFIGQNHNQLAWKWEDGNEILYYNWLPGESKSSAGSCLMMYSQNGKWKANACNTTAFTLCQNGSTMLTSNHDARTGNSTENKPLEAPVNTTGTSTINTTSTSKINTTGTSKINAASTSITTVIIFTLGALFSISAVMNICFIVHLVWLAKGSSRQPENSDENIYYDVNFQPDLVAMRELSRSATMVMATQRDAVAAELDSSDSNETEIIDNVCYGSRVTMKRADSNEEISDEMEIVDNPCYHSLIKREIRRMQLEIPNLDVDEHN